MCRKEKEVEGTHRIKAFLEAISKLDWQNNSERALSSLFNECTALIFSEIHYYYSSRKKSRRLSLLFRGVALLFGTLGFMAPFAEAAGFEDVSVYGFMFLIVAAALFTANSFFGGSTGHARYVTTQLKLERLLVLTVVEWHRMRHLNEPQKQSSHAPLDFLKAQMDEAYKIILEETREWDEALDEAIRDYEKNVQNFGRAS